MREQTIAPLHPFGRPTEGDANELLQRRIDGISKWLAENAPACTVDQKHLDEGTAERQYWHYGYLVALRDMQKLLGTDRPLN